MAYEVEVSDDFKAWYEDLSEPEQNSVERVVLMLMEAGPALGYPQSTGIKGSKFTHMRELRIQHVGRPYRVLFAFYPIRTAFLLVGGDKTGDERWYDTMIPKADANYAEHLKTIKRRPVIGSSNEMECNAMATKWNDLKHKSSPKVRAKLQREAHAELDRIGFRKLRQARQQTQVAVAERLKIGQGAVSRMEKQSDFLLSTLREYVAALGGELELRVVFPDADFVIDTLAPTSAKKRTARTRAASVKVAGKVR